MQDEEKYVVDSFLNNFSKYKEKRIALYGTGANTKIILNNVSGFNFIGLMDGFKNSGSMYGFDILGYDEIKKLNVEVIIIVARISSTKLIYDRIKDFCKENNILTLDCNGNDLSIAKEIFNSENEYFNKNEEELKNLIDTHEIISFDVFDTLITRKVLSPEEIYDIIGKRILDRDLKKFRYSVERWSDNMNVYEVYDEYRKTIGCSEEEKEEIIKTEVATEKDFLSRREKMVEIFNYAVNKGKPVYLISDMDLPKEILGDILNSLDIKRYKDLLVSCDYRMKKREGLFKVFKEKVKGNSYLHIGDSEDSDGIYANMNGIDSYLIKNGYDLLRISSYGNILEYVKTPLDNYILGIFIERAFNNPFVLYNSKGRLKINNQYDKGYLFIGPVISSFMMWFIGNIKEYDKVIFSARDGYLLSKLYEKARKYFDLPKYDYLLTSRACVIPASLEDDEDIKYALTYSFGGSPEEMLKYRFLLDEGDIEKYKGEEVEEYILKHKEKIFAKSKKLKENYLKYLNKFDFNGKIAFFDFVALGTCQMGLEKVINKKLDGFYFIRLNNTFDRINNLNIKAFLENYRDSNIFENYLSLEQAISDFIPSLKCFDSEGNPVFFEDNRSEEDKKYIEELQQGVLDFFEVFLKNYEGEITLSFIDKLFGLIDIEKTDISEDKLKDLSNVDEFCKRG